MVSFGFEHLLVSLDGTTCINRFPMSDCKRMERWRWGVYTEKDGCHYQRLRVLPPGLTFFKSGKHLATREPDSSRSSHFRRFNAPYIRYLHHPVSHSHGVLYFTTIP